MEYGAYESAGLSWKERSDRHWVARGLGGSYDVAPHGEGYHTYFMPDGGGYIDLGHHATLGAAFAAADRAATPPSKAAESPAPAPAAAAAPAPAEEHGPGCAHTHPPEVPSAPCDTPPAGGGPVVIEKTEVTATQTTLVAGEESGHMQWTEHRLPRGGSYYTTQGAWGEYAIVHPPDEVGTTGRWELVHTTGDPRAGKGRWRRIGPLYRSIPIAKKAADDDRKKKPRPKAKRAARPTK
jgi:hypothetical protein